MYPQLESRATSDHDPISPYGYTPTRWVGYFFLIIFIASTVCHFGQAIRYRLWWLIPTICLSGAMESAGWVGRLWSSYNVLLSTPYLMQIVLTILAPTPLVAASFIMLGQVIRRLGQQYSRLSARWYTRIFLSCDIIALLVQGAGGGIAATAQAGSSAIKLGGNLMLGGIIFQLIAITFYMIMGTEFILRYLNNRPISGRLAKRTKYTFDKNHKLMLGALAFSSLCIYVRSWYRTVELADGWDGIIIRTQRLFVIMDALMIAFAMIVMNIFHPGRLLGSSSDWETRDDISMNTLSDAEAPELKRDDRLRLSSTSSL